MDADPAEAGTDGGAQGGSGRPAQDAADGVRPAAEAAGPAPDGAGGTAGPDVDIPPPGGGAADGEPAGDAADEPCGTGDGDPEGPADEDGDGGVPEPGPRPLGRTPARTGHAGVDAALARLAEADRTPTHEHLAMYEDVHADLRETLAALDRRPGPPAPSPDPSPHRS